MAGSLNQVNLIGNLGADPEMRSMNSGDRCANLRVACSESWKDKQTGEKKERTEWVSVTVWGPLAEVCDKYLRKGSKVFLQGKYRTRKWQDNSGNDRYSTEVVIQGPGSQLIMLGDPGAGKSNNDGGGSRHQRNEPSGGYDTGGSRGDDGGGFDPGDLDDEVPF